MFQTSTKGEGKLEEGESGHIEFVVKLGLGIF